MRYPIIRGSACPLRQADLVPDSAGKHGNRRSYTASWDIIERIQETLKDADFNISEAARRLGVDRVPASGVVSSLAMPSGRRSIAGKPIVPFII
ncbi:helix-turn-helix domain-containing protein [Rhizobium alvei]|uniref:helix-turn-helix domain-containing protein n=1 Tax=Rhizobium alvei TaxID=1132659 RepID=UPI00339B2CEE